MEYRRAVSYSVGNGIFFILQHVERLSGVSVVKNLPTSAEHVGSILRLGRSLEKETATSPVFLPGEFHGRRSLVGYTMGSQRVRHARTHAKSLQSCPTLCDPMDSRPLGSAVHRIL